MASKDSQMKDLMSSNEQQLREELQRALERKQKEAVRDADHLTNQVTAVKSGILAGLQI